MMIHLAWFNPQQTLIFAANAHLARERSMQSGVLGSDRTDIYAPPKAVPTGAELASSWPILLGLIAGGVFFRLWGKRDGRREGQLDLEILRTLNREGEMTGIDIQEKCHRNPDLAFAGWGTLYPALKRLKSKGLIVSAWRHLPAESGAKPLRKRYWKLTEQGKEHLGNKEIPRPYR